MLVSAVLATAAIFHGSPAPLAEIPWFAAMYEDGGPVCGGSLLAPDRVLTAAHCVQGTAPGDYAFRINGTTHEVRGAYFPANYRIIPSPLLPLVYSASASANDIAIAVLAEPVTDVAPVTIAATPPADGETTLTVGRGITSPAGDQPSDPLAASETVVPNADCAKTYEKLFHPALHLCTKDASRKHAQACPGDSGSAVLVRRDGVLQLAGLVTWGGETQGKECGEGPIDVSERVLAHQAFLNAPPPAQLAPYGRGLVKVTKHGTLRRCRRGTWHPGGATFTYRWFRRHGERDVYLHGKGSTHRSSRAIGCEVTARTAGGWSSSESYNVQ